MRLVPLLCAGIVAAGAVGATAQESPSVAPSVLTEADALARAMRGSARIEDLRANVQVVRAEHAERRLWPNPEVSYSRESVDEVHDSFVIARQEVPLWGRLGRLRTAGALAVDAAKHDASRAIGRLRADVRAAFADLLAGQQREAAFAERVQALRTLVETLRTREQAGEGSAYDRLRGERELAEREAGHAEAVLSRVRAAGGLAALMGDADVAATILARGDMLPSLPPVGLGDAIARAQATRGDVLAADAAVRRFETERQAAATLRLPTPTIGGGMKRSETGTGAATGYQFSLDLRVPLFDRGQARRALADAEQARTRAHAAWVRTRAAAEVRTAHAALGVSLDNARRYQSAVDQVVDPLATVAALAYDEGEIGILEMLDAERQRLDADLRGISLALAARQAAIELDWAMGLEDQP